MYRLSWLLWLVTILFAWWFIPPRIDDGIYLFPAISVLNDLPPAGIINNKILPVFYIFPTQPFLHGFFLKFLNILSIDVGINTYRIFNYSAVVLLFYFVNKLFITLFHSSKISNYATWVFFIVIGFSQFSVQFFVNRPEVLALVFYTTGLISAINFINHHRKSTFYIASSFLSFGITITLHPSFIIPSGLIVLYLLWVILETRRLKYLGLLVTFFIPLLLFLSWFLLNFEVAFDQLFGRINLATKDSIFSLASPNRMFSTIIGNSDNSLAHKIYLSIHMLTLLIGLLVLFFLSLFRSKKYSIDNKIVNLFKTSSFAAIILFILMEPWPGNYLLVSFLTSVSIIFYIFSLSFGKNTFTNIIYKVEINKTFRIIAYTITFFCILSLPLFHSLKIYASKGYYFDHHATVETISDEFLNIKYLFINTPHLLPLFAEEIDKNFLNKDDKLLQVYWYFPVSSDSSTIKSQELMLQSIANDNVKMENAIWGTLKEYFSQNENSACLTLAAKKHHLKIIGVKVLYEDRDNIFFKSGSAKLSTNEINCNE